jgi:hypothetical protein
MFCKQAKIWISTRYSEPSRVSHAGDKSVSVSVGVILLLGVVAIFFLGGIVLRAGSSATKTKLAKLLKMKKIIKCPRYSTDSSDFGRVFASVRFAVMTLFRLPHQQGSISDEQSFYK